MISEATQMVYQHNSDMNQPHFLLFICLQKINAKIKRIKQDKGKKEFNCLEIMRDKSEALYLDQTIF